MFALWMFVYFGFLKCVWKNRYNKSSIYIYFASLIVFFCNKTCTSDLYKSFHPTYKKCSIGPTISVIHPTYKKCAYGVTYHSLHPIHMYSIGRIINPFKEICNWPIQFPGPTGKAAKKGLNWCKTTCE